MLGIISFQKRNKKTARFALGGFLLVFILVLLLRFTFLVLAVPTLG